MAKLVRQLTDAAARNAKPKASPYTLASGNGLFLQVQPGGGKQWLVRYRLPDGKRNAKVLGTYPDMSIAVAHMATEELHQQVRMGEAAKGLHDRLREARRTKTEEEVQAQRAAEDAKRHCFTVLSDAWLEDRKAGWAITGGESSDLRKLADMMDQVRSAFVSAYVERSGQTADEVGRMMAETTWMDAFEAQRLGFCDEVEDPVRLVASASAANVLAKYKGAPAALLASVQRAAARPRQGPATETPEMLVKYIYDECRAQGVPHLAEALVVGAVSGTRAQAMAKVESAIQVAGVCLAARRQNLAADFVKLGLGVEQVRARLFDMLAREDEAVVISNLQRPAGSEATGQGEWSG